MKTILATMGLVAAILMTGVAGTAAAGEGAAGAGTVEVSFDYRKQDGRGSNQFAVWIERDGRVVRTLFVTDFTARRGGWEYREHSLPLWVKSAGVAAMPKAAVDAVSGATPASGRVTHLWRCDGEDGAPVQPGEHTVVVEATLRGENGVVYRENVRVGGPASRAEPQPQFTGGSTAERNMVTGVVVSYVP